MTKGRAGDEKYLDLGKMKTELEGSDSFNCKFKALLCEYKLQRCIVRTPEEELGTGKTTGHSLSQQF